MASYAFYATQDRRILLIHGYNVPEPKGLLSMTKLRYGLARRSPLLGDQCLTVTWPGNRSWLKGGPAAYHRILPSAVASAEVLYDYLLNEYQDGRGARQLVLIAHSMGCRLTLELLQRFRRAERPARLEKIIVILMAAAVPIDMHELIRDSVANVDEIVVLHSPDDKVLERWFPRGQTMAGEGVMPEAIGLYGQPTVPGWSWQKLMPGYDHGDYWGGDETAEAVCQALRLYLPEVLFSDIPVQFRKMRESRPIDAKDLLVMHSLGGGFEPGQ